MATLGHAKRDSAGSRSGRSASGGHRGRRTPLPHPPSARGTSSPRCAGSASPPSRRGPSPRARRWSTSRRSSTQSHEPFARTITLLGQRVSVEATPSTYTWHHGDGSTTTTDSPGARYPAKDVVHEYLDAHTTVSPRVDVTYTARFRVNDGPWQDIDETVTITGPGGSLRVSEATAVLSGDVRVGSSSSTTRRQLSA